MEYFEVKDRVENLERFRTMYREYIDFTNRETNVPAQMVRRRMEPLAWMAVDSLQHIGLGAMVTHDAPSRGGRKIRINIIKAIFRDHVIRRFLLDDLAPLEVLEEGIARYRSLLARRRVQLFNPFFWIYHAFGFVARLPLLICRKAGYDTRHAEKLTSVRVYVILFQLIAWYWLLKLCGLFSWF